MNNATHKSKQLYTINLTGMKMLLHLNYKYKFFKMKKC